MRDSAERGPSLARSAFAPRCAYASQLLRFRPAPRRAYVSQLLRFRPAQRGAYVSQLLRAGDGPRSVRYACWQSRIPSVDLLGAPAYAAIDERAARLAA